MGYYINTDSKGNVLRPLEFVKHLVEDGAMIVTPEWQENLICVIENNAFDAAGYCYSENEFEHFKEEDGRHKTWLTHPLAKQLSGFSK